MSLWELEGAGLPFNETLRKQEETVDFPMGYGTWAVMLFITPFDVRLNRQIYHGKPGDLLINRPDTPMWHKGSDTGYQNHWIHFYGKTVSNEIERYSLTLDIPFTPQKDYSNLFREIHWESIERPPYYKESISRTIKNLFLSLHREESQFGEELSDKDSKRRSDFISLRRRISRELTRTWTIPLMAEILAISPSRFAALYKEYFAITPLNDLNRCRLEYAKQLLSNPAISVKQAAWESGFRDLPYFNRYFKTQAGLSPGRWRQK